MLVRIIVRLLEEIHSSHRATLTSSNQLAKSASQFSREEAALISAALWVSDLKRGNGNAQDLSKPETMFFGKFLGIYDQSSI
jgi:hypothetical protein